jgi:hypothetical protein
MQSMDVSVTFTLYFSFCAFLVFPKLEAPPLFAKMAITLCAYELVITAWWAAARSSCTPTGCPPLVRTLRSMAGLEVPALTGLMFLIALGYGLSVARSW